VQRVVVGIQAKLKVGQPGDKYEQEADRVADAVMHLSDPQVQRQPEEEEEEELIQTKPLADPITPLMQRPVEEEEAEILQTKENPDLTPEVTPDFESRIQSLKSSGQSLPEVNRGFMERRFGIDFSGVRLHTDSDAAQMSRELNAEAFTYGRDIYFGAGRYSPGTSSGKRLLAHELTHVVQQSSGKGISFNKFSNIQQYIQVSHRSSQSIIHCLQSGHPSSDTPYFTYELDAAFQTYYGLAVYYGIENWEDIRNITPGSQTLLHLGDVVRIPARPVPSGTVQVVGSQPGLVIAGTTAIPFRWWNSNNANMIGRVPRGTRINIGTTRGGFKRTWISSTNLQNRAGGIITELEFLNRTAGNEIYGYLPVANTRIAARTVPGGEIDLLARMIWGEQSSQGRDAMVVAAWTVKNRYDAGWGAAYDAILTDREYHALRPSINARTRDMTTLTGPNQQAWTTAQQVARGVIEGTIADPTIGRGFYFGNGDTVRRRMDRCRRRLPEFEFHSVGRNMYWSNGNYTGGTPTNPNCRVVTP
jgi:hypothetical protein